MFCLARKRMPQLTGSALVVLRLRLSHPKISLSPMLEGKHPTIFRVSTRALLIPDEEVNILLKSESQQD
jgi:hypothetical protein